MNTETRSANIENDMWISRSLCFYNDFLFILNRFLLIFL